MSHRTAPERKKKNGQPLRQLLYGKKPHIYRVIFDSDEPRKSVNVRTQLVKKVSGRAARMPDPEFELLPFAGCPNSSHYTVSAQITELFDVRTLQFCLWAEQMDSSCRVVIACVAMAMTKWLRDGLFLPQH